MNGKELREEIRRRIFPCPCCGGAVMLAHYGHGLDKLMREVQHAIAQGDLVLWDAERAEEAVANGEATLNYRQ